MSVAAAASVLESQMWPQQDARDPLGMWGARAAVTGDATGGQTEFTYNVPANKAGRFIYACYGATFVQTTNLIALASQTVMLRLLTNWPNIDPQPGVQGFSTSIARTMQSDADLGAPNAAPDDQLLGPLDRFILLFAPASFGVSVDIMSIRLAENLSTEIFVSEAYGYYWDREVMNQPGGPRHPGAN